MDRPRLVITPQDHEYGRPGRLARVLARRPGRKGGGWRLCACGVSAHGAGARRDADALALGFGLDRVDPEISVALLEARVALDKVERPLVQEPLERATDAMHRDVAKFRELSAGQV